MHTGSREKQSTRYGTFAARWVKKQSPMTLQRISFAKFKSEDLTINLDKGGHSGHSVRLDESRLLKLVEEDLEELLR